MIWKNYSPPTVPVQLIRTAKLNPVINGGWAAPFFDTPHRVFDIHKITTQTGACYSRGGIAAFGRGFAVDGSATYALGLAAAVRTTRKAAFSLWFTPLLLPSQAGSIVFTWQTGAFNIHFRFNGSTTDIEWCIQTNSTGQWVIRSLGDYSTFTLGKVVHTACNAWYDSGTYYLETYINGVYQGQSSNTDTLNENNWSSIMNNSNGSYPATAIWHEARGYGRLLTPAEIEALYQPATRWDIYRPVLPRAIMKLPETDLNVNICPLNNSVPGVRIYTP